MGTVTVVALAALLVALPYWLPPLVVRLRMMIFTRINGEQTLELPNETMGPGEFREVYQHPGSRGRSRGARLSDLFWYWLSPGPQWHLEHLEDGPEYEQLAGLTRRILARPRSYVEALVHTCAIATPELQCSSYRITRLRDMVMPFWARFFFELLFDERCDDATASIVESHSRDVANALKCCGVRHMGRRERLTRLLVRKLENGDFPHEFPIPMSTREQAYFLQGAFFTTGVIQMSDATAHLLMVLAEHGDVQERMHANPEDHRYFNRVVTETLRMYPLFGIAHRIMTTEIEVAGRVIDRGSVVCFNYPAFHNRDIEDPQSFRPDRWESAMPINYMPFGAMANRPCPAQGLALTAMRRLALLVIRRYRLNTAARHERALASRGPCLMVNRQGREPGRLAEQALLRTMRIRDRWEGAGRGVAQLVLGTLMVIDARHDRLCENHFGRADAAAQTAGESGCRKGA